MVQTAAKLLLEPIFEADFDPNAYGYRPKRSAREAIQKAHQLRDRLNRVLRGWSNYFGYGTRKLAYRAIDQYVYQGVRSFLRRRHKVPSRGTIPYSDAAVFGTLGVLRLRDVHLGPLP